MFAKPIDRYVTVEMDGATVSAIEIRKEKPGFRAADTAFARALESYFETGKDAFSAYEPDYSGMTPFRKMVMQKLRKVPAGTTLTYGELAAIAGRPGAARAVGNVMATNPVPLLVPCHRVVATQGLGGFGGGLDVKRSLLRLEATKT